MICQTEELLPVIKRKLEKNEQLKKGRDPERKSKTF